MEPQKGSSQKQSQARFSINKTQIGHPLGDPLETMEAQRPGTISPSLKMRSLSPMQDHIAQSPRPCPHPPSTHRVGVFLPLRKHINAGVFCPPEKLFPAQWTHSRRFHMAPLFLQKQL